MRLPESILQAALRHLSPLKPNAIYLFGSFGTERQHPGSDVDFAVLPSGPLDPVQLFQIAGNLSTELNRDADLVDLSRATTVMAKEVLRTGERIDVRDLHAAREFEMRTLSDYARLNEERQPVLAR